MLDQATFNLAEDIAEVLHEQEGLSMSLLSYMNGKLDPQDEQVFHALILAQGSCRNRARDFAGKIAKSGVLDG